MSVLKINLTPRACECCSGTDIFPVWSSETLIVRARNTWRFPFNIALCRQCGFCFSSPGPDPADLEKYHAEGLTGYKEIGLPYSIEARISVLKRYSIPTGVFVEVGGDAPDEFHRSCEALFGQQLSVEIATDTPSDYRSVYELKNDSVDVLAHYDVLEHIVKARDFLHACWRSLRYGGIMVCEVPDLRLYPRNLLLLEFEHVNHFSITTLSYLAQQVGFNLVEVGHECSRPYGFFAVFRKENLSTTFPHNGRGEYLDALACVQGGLTQIRRMEFQIDRVRQQILNLGKAGKKVTLWAVNDITRRLLTGFELPPEVTVVDVDPRRKFHLTEEEIVVAEPKDVKGHIAESELLVICAARYQTNILDWVRKEIGISFFGSRLVVLGTGSSGETLT